MTYHREGIEYIKISGYLIVNEQNLPIDNMEDEVISWFDHHYQDMTVDIILCSETEHSTDCYDFYMKLSQPVFGTYQNTTRDEDGWDEDDSLDSYDVNTIIQKMSDMLVEKYHIAETQLSETEQHINWNEETIRYAS